MFIDINTRFFYQDYMINNKAKSDIDRKTLEDSLTLAQDTIDLKVQTHVIPITSGTWLPHHRWWLTPQIMMEEWVVLVLIVWQGAMKW